MTDTTTIHLTADEYANLPESTALTQLLDGELIVNPSPTVSHQNAALAIAVLLRRRIPAGRVNIAPNDVYLDDHNVVQPDVFWAGAEGSRCQIGADDRWHGAPDLVVEVLSPSTAAHDRGDKFGLYRDHGVREYWIVEPEARFIEVFTLQDGDFVRHGLYEADAAFTSPLLGGDAIPVAPLFG